MMCHVDNNAGHGKAGPAMHELTPSPRLSVRLKLSLSLRIERKVKDNAFFVKGKIWP